jgi:esterase/lipase superfamily enzyme
MKRYLILTSIISSTISAQIKSDANRDYSPITKIDSTLEGEYFLTNFKEDFQITRKDFNENIDEYLTNKKGKVKKVKKKKNIAPSLELVKIDTGQYDQYTLMPIYYATDRAKQKMDLEEFYGGERSNNKMSYGYLEVSIPESHKRGLLEVKSAFNIFDTKSSKKYIGIQTLFNISKEHFYDFFDKNNSRASRDDLLIFIHGYNSTFAEGAKRAAQLAYDIGYNGRVVYYSWTSVGRTTAYVKDGTNAELTQPYFQEFLQEIISTSKAKNINVIAHSMGNRVLTNTLKTFAEQNKNIAFNQIILAAPDIDATIFERDIAPRIVPLAKRYTIYTAKDDRALNISEVINGYARLGKINKAIKGFQTVDASNVIKEDLFNHSYFVSSYAVIEDIIKLFNYNAPPEKRNLISKGEYWAIKK